MLPGLMLSGLLFAALAWGETSVAPVMRQQKPAPPGPFQTLFGAAHQAHSTARLFVPRVREPQQTPDRKDVCGMIVIVPKATDPGMVKPIPADGVTYTIRRIPPPACSDTK